MEPGVCQVAQIMAVKFPGKSPKDHFASMETIAVRDFDLHPDEDHVAFLRSTGRALDGVPRGFGRVLAASWRGPPEGRRCRLFDLPARVLLEPVVPAALRTAVAQAGSAARLVGDIVFEVAV